MSFPCRFDFIEAEKIGILIEVWNMDYKFMDSASFMYFSLWLSFRPYQQQ